MQQDKFQRNLIYIPVIHTSTDLGELAEHIRKAVVKECGEEWWQMKVQAIDNIWDQIEKMILSKDLEFEQVRIYQDGLPICGREQDIVSELADSGSRNHQLLLKLIKRGATIMGTESSELLLQEYKHIKQGVLSEEVNKKLEQDREGSDLLLERDKFIAARINSTLKTGEIGILFLGMLHCIQTWLAEDIRVQYPINRPQ